MSRPDPLPGTAFARRSLLQAFGASAILALAGCSSAVGEQRTGTSGSTPQAGGTLRAGINEDLIPGNFFTNSSAGLTTVIGLVYDSLIRYPNDRVEPQPRLATSWTPGADGTSLTLQLRDDVTWHSGRAFTSKDVEFSLTTYADPKWNGQLKSTAQAITGYDTSKPNEITLTFAHPLGNIFDLLDTAPIIDRETFADLATGKKYVGTGPFTFGSWTPNSKLTFAKNPKYWQPGRPYLDAVEVSVIPNSTSLFSAVRSGQVLLAANNSAVNYRDIESLSGKPGFSHIQGTGAELQIYVGANVTAPGLTDLRVRQAIAHLLDRDRIVSEVFRGSGYTINLPWPKYSSAYDASKNATYTRNVAKASALIAAAKADGVTIPALPLTYTGTNGLYAATAQIVQANLKEAGIEVQLDPVDGAQFVKQLIGAEFKGLWTTFHSWAQYTPSTLNVSAYPFNAAKNASRFSSAEYTADANSAWQVADGASAEAKAQYAKVSDDLLKNLFLIEIAVVEPRFLHSTKVSGVSYTKRSEIQLTDAYLTAAD